MSKLTYILLSFFILLTINSISATEKEVVGEFIQEEKYVKAIGYLQKSMPDIALHLLFDILEYDSLDIEFTTKVKISIAEGYREKREYEKGISILYQVIYNKKISYQNLIRAYNRLSALFTENTNSNYPYIDSALKYSLISLELSKQYNYEKYIASTLNELGYIYREKDYTHKAEEYYLRAYNIYYNDENYLHAANVAINLSVIYADSKKYTHANSILDKFITILEEEEYRYMFMRLYLQKSYVYERMGICDSSYKYLARGRISQKHYFMDKIDNQIHEMAAKYELKQKENKIIEEKIIIEDHKKHIIYLTIIVISLFIVFIISILIMFMRRKVAHQKQRISEYENKLLENKIVHKEDELTNAIAHYVSLNELLRVIKSHINQKDYKEAVSTINMNISNENNWLQFNKQFSENNPQFFYNIKTIYPNLTENETKLMALLYLNLKSKEIAEILSITLSSVNKSRQRLRKKLELPLNTDLYNYLKDNF